MVLERQVKRQVEKVLQTREPRCYFVKQTSDQPSGTPDLLVCYRGCFIAMELKRPGQHPTKLQQQRMKAIQEAGGIAVKIDSAAQALYVLNQIDLLVKGEGT